MLPCQTIRSPSGQKARRCNQQFNLFKSGLLIAYQQTWRALYSQSICAMITPGLVNSQYSIVLVSAFRHRDLKAKMWNTLNAYVQCLNSFVSYLINVWQASTKNSDHHTLDAMRAGYQNKPPFVVGRVQRIMLPTIGAICLFLKINQVLFRTTEEFS